MQFLFTILGAACVTLMIGFIWYHPKVLGSVWIRESGVSEEKIKSSNMPLIIGLCFLFSLMLSAFMYVVVVHQAHIYSIFANMPDAKDPSTELGVYLKNFMDNYGKNFRTFKHGAFHGALATLFFVLPIIAINALFERRSYKYILVHLGYWMITLIIIGGIVCQFAP